MELLASGREHGGQRKALQLTEATVPTHVMHLGNEVAAGMQMMYITSVGVPCWWRAWCINRSPKSPAGAARADSAPGQPPCSQKTTGPLQSRRSMPLEGAKLCGYAFGTQLVVDHISLKKSYFWQLQAKQGVECNRFLPSCPHWLRRIEDRRHGARAPPDARLCYHRP
jgi:hypothetical protein